MRPGKEITSNLHRLTVCAERLFESGEAVRVAAKKLFELIGESNEMSKKQD